MTRPSKSGMQVPQPPELIHLIIPLILLPPPNAESLNELGKVEDADLTAIMSVQFDPDGKTIVSGASSLSGVSTLKVWDAGASRLVPHEPSIQPKLTTPLPAAASLDLKAEKQSAHNKSVNSVAFSPDGKTIWSGSDDRTIKVWSARPFDASFRVGKGGHLSDEERSGGEEE